MDEFTLAPSTGGVGGIFEVSLNGDLIFSKKELNRYPEPDEVENIVREKLGKPKSLL